MQLSPTGLSASFDEPNLVSAAGLVPVMSLARDAELGDLAQKRLSVPTDKGANAGLKVSSLVAGMVAGADSIDDMAILRHGGMGRLFKACYAPSTLGSFLRTFTFGHVRQLDGVASRFLTNLAARTRCWAARRNTRSSTWPTRSLKSTATKKQGSGYDYSGIRGLNALLAIRQHEGHGAGHPRPAAAQGLDPAIRRAIASIDGTVWQPIQYTDAVFDEASDRWISSAEVAETPLPHSARGKGPSASSGACRRRR